MPELVRDPETGDLILREPVDIGPAKTPVDHGANLALSMDRDELDTLAARLTESLSHDLSERGDWEVLTTRYMQAMGIGPESKPDDYDYEFSDTSDHPLLATAVTKFQAKALSAVLPSPERVARVVPGVDLDRIEDPRVRKATAIEIENAVRRVDKFYQWYYLDALPSYVEDTDRIIHDCGLHGLGVRRITVDTTRTRTPVRPIYVPLEDLIFSYNASNFRESPRLSHRRTQSTADLIRDMQSGRYVAADVMPGVDLRTSSVTEERDRIFGLRQSSITAMQEHKIYDVFVNLFLESDLHPKMLARPYIVSIHATSQQVLGVYRNWEEGDEDEEPIEHFVGYVYSPGRNAMSTIGLGALLSNITMALRKAQRRALDAAYLANHPSGFIAGGMSIRDGDTKFMPGSLRTVDVGNGDLQRSILINPFRGPEQGLLALYDRMEASGKELGNIASIDFAAMMKSGIAAGPALAAYDESTEFQTSVHRRLYRAQAVELKLVHRHLQNFIGGRQVMFATQGALEPDDLFVTELRPAMMPGHVSRQRAIMEGQMLFELATAEPQVVNKRAAIVRLLTAMGTPDIEGVLLPDPEADEVPAFDPATEYSRVLRGEPVRPSVEQNHRAHIDAHAAQLRGLQRTQLPTEMGDLAAAMLGAHIAEHEAMDLMVQVAAMLGMPVDMLMEGLPPEIEVQIAPQMAAAIQQIEAARAEREEVDPRIAVEQIRAESRRAIEDIKSERAELDRLVQVEITRMREEAATYRNITDNLYGIEIAEMRDMGKPPVKPPVPNAPNLGPRTEVPRFRFNR